MATYENHSRTGNWGPIGKPTLEDLNYGATARIATALEDLNSILRNESQWCKIVGAVKKIAQGRVTIRYELRINIHWPWFKKRKK